MKCIMPSPIQEEMIRLAATYNALLDPAAVEELGRDAGSISKLEFFLKSMKEVPLIITAEMLRDTAEGKTVMQRTVGHLSSKQERPKVIHDITGRSTSTGNVKDFAHLFTDRFHSIKKMLQRRRDMSAAVPISRIEGMERDVTVIGIVNSVHRTAKGYTVLEIEDEEAECSVLVKDMKDGDTVLNDEVIGVKGRVEKSRMTIYAREIIRPDIPFRDEETVLDTSSRIAVLSDTHVGSKTFLRREWGSMIHWLSTSSEARDINYLIISGDLADGIGVYPDQEDDLEIEDIYEQYERVAQYVQELPDWMHIILLPGNHDAVRPAEPQPTFQQELRRLFDSSVTFVGNPATLEIEGRRILTYHGRSFDDIISAIPGLTWEKPVEAMVELLKRRHLAPVYGQKTPLAPEKRDYMVIDEVPDVFITGHIHSYGLSDYRGVRLVSGSTWQSQTAYQRMRNIAPVPAKMPVISIADLSMRTYNFSSYSE